MVALQIVKLSPQDWPLYKQLRLEALSDSPQAFGSGYAETLTKPDSFWQTRLADAQAGEKSWLLFAREDGRLVGLIGAFRSDDDPTSAHIVSVYVSPQYRGRGIGAALMAAILAEIDGRSFHTARLNVTAGQEAALALYRRFGFRIIAQETDLMGDGIARTSFTMQKEL